MTVEDIFKKHFEKQGYSDDNISPDAKKAIIDAMEEYANLKIAQKHESMHTMEQEFKKGERVLVKNNGMHTWVERIFLCEDQGKYYCKMPLNGLPHVYDEIKKIETVYRLLNKDEITKEGDQIMMSHDIWAMAKEGVKVGYSTIRRKIKTYEE